MTDIDGVARDIDSESYVGTLNRAVKANLKIGSAGGSSGIYCHHGGVLVASGNLCPDQ
ncbi:unnamed protein product, partial [marine sediment metagenome]